jgi:hypothetical protein
MMIQVVSTLFEIMARREDAWWDVTGATAVPLFGFPHAVGLDAVPVKLDGLLRIFHQAAEDLPPVWESFLSADSLEPSLSGGRVTGESQTNRCASCAKPRRLRHHQARARSSSARSSRSTGSSGFRVETREMTTMRRRRAGIASPHSRAHKVCCALWAPQEATVIQKPGDRHPRTPPRAFAVIPHSSCCCRTRARPGLLLRTLLRVLT